MARANIPTWLPLDRWAIQIGLHPLHFNQLYHTSLAKVTSVCSDVWFQWDWQGADHISRESLAQAIQDAERMIAEYVGYHLLPDWVEDERVRTARPRRTELFLPTPYNARGMYKSVESRYGHVLSGGVRAKILIGAGAVANGAALTDVDHDGWNETVTIAVVTSVTDPDEVHVYYPGYGGDDKWEVRPIDVTISAGIATITFKRWQLVSHEQLDRMGAGALDATVDANFEATVDVYRLYTDPQTQVYLTWEQDPANACGCGSSTCYACTHGYQTGCLSVRDKRLGMLTYIPAEWDSNAQNFNQADLVVCREPDYLRLWYYSGWQNPDPREAMPWTHLDPYWERAVARLACALLDRDICSCNNAERFVEFWRTDLSRVEGSVRFQATTQAQLENPFGATRGGVYAWKLCNAEGRRLGR